jgi:membrane protein YdbS with pleckstrin-like domain
MSRALFVGASGNRVMSENPYEAPNETPESNSALEILVAWPVWRLIVIFVLAVVSYGAAVAGFRNAAQALFVVIACLVGEFGVVMLLLTFSKLKGWLSR